VTGRLIGVVGPSGAGKDTLMAALAEASPRVLLVRRVITRPAEMGGEDFDGVSEAAFENLASTGAFCVHWRAHGLRYGIPVTVRRQIADGQDMLVNLSREVLREVADAFERFSVLHVTASRTRLAERLTARGRETPDEIERRLARAVPPLPGDLDILTVENDGPVSETVARALALLHPARA